jgi:hypothetical protein
MNANELLFDALGCVVFYGIAYLLGLNNIGTILFVPFYIAAKYGESI